MKTMLGNDIHVDGFIEILEGLEPFCSISDEYERDCGQKQRVWWTSQKEHLIGWFGQQNSVGSGAFSREVPNTSARTTYNKLAAPGALIWLAEALGEKAAVVQAAADAARKEPNVRRRSGIVRSHVGWDRIAHLAAAHMRRTANMPAVVPAAPEAAPEAAPAAAQVPARSYESVLNSIEADLRDGRIKVGDQLPGERALALKHGISRASVRDAIRVLDVMGVVRTGTGSGPQSGAVVIANPMAGLASALRLHMATNHFPVADIVQTRIMMESWAALEAAGRPRSAGAEDSLRELLHAMEAPDLDREEFHVLDAAFHVQLSALAGNAVITAMMESLRLAIQGYVSDGIDNDVMWAAMAPTLKDQHRHILSAVLAGEGPLAAGLLKDHIEWFHSQTHPLQ